MDFERIYRMYFKDVFLYLRALSADTDTAEEITQETFVKALRSIDTFDGSKDIRAWLFTIARNTYYTYCRRQTRYADEELSENEPDIRPDFTEQFADKERALQIHRFLHGMDEPYKEVFSLRVFGELPFEKIGAIFGKSSGWARVTFYLDGVVSDDTRQMVEEHLRTCDQCREEAVTLKQDVALPASKSVRLAETEVVRGLKKKLFRKKFLISAVSVIITIAVLSGVYSCMVMTETCVPYNSGKVWIEEENGALYVVYEGDDLGGTVSFDPMEVNVDGEEETVFSFYCYTTLWSEYVEPLFDDETEQTRKRLMYVGEEDEIDRICYGEFDSYDPLTPGYDYASVLAGPDMEVVWEK